MIVVRTVHFAATAITAGALTFRTVVAGPAFRSAGDAGKAIDAQVRPAGLERSCRGRLSPARSGSPCRRSR